MYLRKTFLLLFIPFISAFGQGQFGNEWIDFQQKYWKISVLENGVYELPLAQFNADGFDVNSIEPENIQLFYMGKEVAIQVTEQLDGTLDKLVFYGEKNKGDLDSLVYRPADARMNPNQSLFSDESAYFLTVAGNADKRMEVLPHSEFPMAAYHIKRELISYEKEYSFNNSLGLLPNLQQSYYEIGEGWSGVFRSADSSSSFTVPVNGYYTGTNYQSRLKFKLNGRSRTSHKIRYAINGEIQSDTLSFDGFEEIEKEIAVNEIGGAVKVDFYPIVQEEFDWYSVTYFDFNYPQEMALIENQNQINTLEGFNYPFKTGAINISDKWNAAFYESKEATFSSAANAENFYFDGYKAVPKVERITFEEIIPTDYNYVILTSESLLDGAMAYADYRSSAAGGNYKTLVLTSSQVYNHFTFGLRNPLAVRRMADLLLQNTMESKFLFLLGRGVSFPDVLKSSQEQDLVPSFGYPGSDVLLTAGAGQELSDVAGMPTGRLNVTNNEQIFTYLDKVKETEAAPKAQAWKKRFLHLSGGKEPFEINSLARTLENITPQARDNFWGADITSSRKQSLEEVENIDISKEVNEGVGMITFAGHGSANVIDLNIGYCSDLSRNFDNKGKYPLMFFNGCGVGNVFYRYDPLTTDWLLTPNKGAIAVFANSFWSYLLPTQLYLNRLYEKLFVEPETIGLTLGEIQQAVNRDLEILKGNDYILANMHQMILQGDPAIKMFAMEAADFVMPEDGFYMSSLDGAKTINQSDSIFINAAISNFGKHDKNAIFSTKVSIEHGGETSTFNFPTKSFGREDSLVLKVPNYSDVTSISLVLNDGGTRLDELAYDNNEFSLVFDNWEAAGTANIYPTQIAPDNVAPLVLVKMNNKQIENGDYVAASSTLEVKLIDENSLTNSQIELLSLILISSSGEETPILINSTDFKEGNELIANALLNLEPGSYQLKVEGNDVAGNQAAVYSISFVVVGNEAETSMVTYPNPVLNGGDAYVAYQVVSPSNPTEGMLRVYNNQGRLMYAKKVLPSVGKNIETLAVDAFSAGVYTVKLELIWAQKEENLTSRFVIP
ncbi:putative type IX secretion system sortase PorU2 [Arcticibacterium luteifluviistationis]|uniref:Gingipain domain-containing protein n=1 Tax=Arcticibacterium luteifluviistationis TaxID=1784714 RepID=A0A2Z4GDL4_9BACT|nr:C25 family cysteine peptidase [Arcticibacterium luteifluviistationis]AWV99207.1 hypothetical protein DJ013_13945 [Arcticibacterium luteifluviistationis]